MNYETIIGLEVHAQLKTNTKLFCSCSTQFGAGPNTQTCPVCLALPGVLPVLNEKAVDYAIKAGLALGCEIQPKSVFARKNYFYPDLPKGYQISQYELPICLKGHVDIEVEGNFKRVGLTRIHMEEDAGKSLHDFGSSDESHIDLNRACTPLIEIVSEPDLRSATEAVAYLKRLRDILMYIDVCDGNMEEGSFRCDANVSIRPRGETKFGTRVELKNINSFKFVEKAILYEVERQKNIIQEGGKITQETRLFNSDKGTTESMRSKEEAHDYRYFPDPDLLPLILSNDKIETIRKNLPELGHEKAKRFVEEYSIPEYDAQVLTNERKIADYFEEVAKTTGDAKKTSNVIMTELMALVAKGENAFDNIPAVELSIAIQKMLAGTISSKMLKDVVTQMNNSKEGAESIIGKMGAQLSDTSAIESIIDAVIAANPDNVAQYKSGKDKLFGFFVGQVMKESKGKANPQIVNDLLKKKL